MNTLLFVNATIGFSENLFLVINIPYFNTLTETPTMANISETYYLLLNY